ncbi:MAG: hypothetical protein IJC39_03675, partial [Firmicutes bacterium]|nr:hypothetical protein [Bacillota bacterium]
RYQATADRVTIGGAEGAAPDVPGTETAQESTEFVTYYDYPSVTEENEPATEGDTITGGDGMGFILTTDEAGNEIYVPA